MPKRDKLSIHNRIEEASLSLLSLAIDSALHSRRDKIPLLMRLRREAEILKHLVRLEYDLGLIKEKTYLALARMIQDISMMATGWQKSIQTQKPSP